MANKINDNEVVNRSDRYPVVAVRSDWARQFGAVAAIWLSQATFTQIRKGEGNWWYKNRCAKYDEAKQMLPPANKSEQSFEWETGLTRSQQESARALFRALGILKEQQRGIPKRIEYLIDLKRLAEITAQWAITAGSTLPPTVPQDMAVPTAGSSLVEGEVEQSSTETLKKTPLKGRRSSPASKNSHVSSRPTYGSESVVTRMSTTLGGIQCWTDHDRASAVGLLEKFGEEKVAAAVQKIERGGESPLPSRVRLALCQSASSNEIEKTRAMMDRYNADDETKKAKRAAAQQLIRSLPKTQFDEFRRQFLDQNEHLRTTPFHHTTGKWANPATAVQFNRWLENHFLNGGGAGGSGASPDRLSPHG